MLTVFIVEYLLVERININKQDPS